MRIAKQGWPFIAVGLAFAALSGVLALIWPWAAALEMFGGLLATGFAAFCAYFFRDPERPWPADPKKIYSPADGRVLSVAREGPADIVTLRIFLSIFDVHVQRLPCSGKVDRVEYQKGTFKMAMQPGAKLNERNWVRIVPEGGRQPVVVEQIAGFIARRIECWVKEGESARAGERYGIIYFGSQVAVHLPKEVRPSVGPGDRVVGGVTEIGTWTS